MTLPQRIKIAEQLVHRVTWPDLDIAALRRFVETAKAETESPAGARPGTSRHRALEIAAAADVLVCGIELIPIVAGVFQLKDGCRSWVSGGSAAGPGVAIASLEGPENLVTPAAEVACSILRRLSGIATHARKHVSALGDGRTRLLDRGEFTPGWRMLEKFALGSGGAWDGGNDLARTRIDAADRTVAEVESAVRRARDLAPEAPVEIVVHDPGQIPGAISASPDLIRLEGFPASKIRDSVAAVNGRAFVEAHGGISLANIGAHAGLGLDFISVDGLVSDAGWAPMTAVWRD